jgi:hypothetical protein
MITIAKIKKDNVTHYCFYAKDSLDLSKYPSLHTYSNPDYTSLMLWVGNEACHFQITRDTAADYLRKIRKNNKA